MPSYNQLAASSLLNQQYAAALGLGILTSSHALDVAVSKSLLGAEILSTSVPFYLFVFQHQDFRASRPDEAPW